MFDGKPTLFYHPEIMTSTWAALVPSASNWMWSLSSSSVAARPAPVRPRAWGIPEWYPLVISAWWFQPILKNMKVNGKDYPIYYGKIKNVWNHQPDLLHRSVCPAKILYTLQQLAFSAAVSAERVLSVFTMVFVLIHADLPKSIVYNITSNCSI